MSRPTASLRRQSLRALLLFSLLPVLPASLGAQQITNVYFEQESRYAMEYETVAVSLRTSRATAVPIVVPFRIGSGSTATLQTEEDGDGDFFIPADDDPDDGNDLLFDPATGEGSLTFPAGARTRSITIELHNDFVAEELETLVIEIIADEVTVARPVGPLSHTIFIQDDDQPADAGSPFGPRLYFQDTFFQVAEGQQLSIPLRLRGRSAEPLVLTWRYVFESGDNRAEPPDVEVASDESPESNFTVNISPNLDQTTLRVRTTADVEVEGPERFGIELVSLTAEDDSSQTFEFDERTITVEIVDDDPTEVYFALGSLEEAFWEGTTISEGDSLGLTLAVNNPVEEAIRVPISFAGSAVRRIDDSTENPDFQIAPEPSEEGFLTIPADQRNITVSVRAINDLAEESEESVTLTLGTPYIQRGDTRVELALGDPSLGQVSEFTVTIEDNDPVDLGFGVVNPDYEPGVDDRRFFYDPEFVVAESDATVSIPVLFSGRPAENTTFALEIVSDGTTATPLDFSRPASEQEGWDFYLSQPQQDDLDETVNVTVGAGNLGYNVQVVLNNNTEPALPLANLESYLAGEALPEDLQEIEPDETIRLRLVEIVNAGDSGVSLRQGATEFTLVIKEVPDIDVTAGFTGTTPLTDNWVQDGDGDGLEPPRNAITALHELHYRLVPTDSFIAQMGALVGSAENDYADAALRGYTGYRVAFQPGEYDPATGEGDTLIPSSTPNGIDPFFYTVDAPYRLRFPTLSRFVLVEEGAPQTNPNRFTADNADIVTREDSVLQSLNFADLDPDPLRGEVREGYFSYSDSMDFLLEWANRGRLDFALDRVLPTAEDPENMRILLSRVAEPSASLLTFNGEIADFYRREDGSYLLELYNPGAGNIQIEYLDTDGVWRLAQPGAIQQAGTIFHWIDHGPPKTHPHPAEVPFRLYRVNNR